MKALLFLLFICCITINCLCQPYAYKFNYLTVDEGLSHTDANDVAQDDQGYIWIATYFGLDRYDGYTIKKYYNNNDPLHNAFRNRIVCLYPDKAGNIWLGTEDGLQCFDTKTEKYTEFQDPEINGNPGITKLYKPADNFIYCLTATGLKLYSIQQNKIVEQKLNISTGIQFSDMASGKNGSLYLASNKGLWLLNKNRKLQKINITNLSDENLSNIYFDKQNNLLIAGGNKIFLIKAISEIASNQTLHIIRQFVCTDYNNIKSIAEDNNSNYWINVGEALLKFDNNFNFIQAINKKSALHSLNSTSLATIFIDRSECLWVCTFGGGVNYCDLNEKLFYTLQHNPEVSNSFSGNHIRSVLEDGENLWIGTTANGLNLYNLKTQTFTYYNTYNSPVKIKK